MSRVLARIHFHTARIQEKTQLLPNYQNLSSLPTGKYPFRLDSDSDPKSVVLTLQIPKHLETALLDCDVNPSYVRVIVKDKLTQLKLPCEVKVSETKVQRSKVTGELKITMPRETAAIKGSDRTIKQMLEETKERRRRRKLRELGMLDDNYAEGLSDDEADAERERELEAELAAEGDLFGDNGSKVVEKPKRKFRGVAPDSDDEGSGKAYLKKKAAQEEAKAAAAAAAGKTVSRTAGSSSILSKDERKREKKLKKEKKKQLAASMFDMQYDPIHDPQGRHRKEELVAIKESKTQPTQTSEGGKAETNRRLQKTLEESGATKKGEKVLMNDLENLRNELTDIKQAFLDQSDSDDSDNERDVSMKSMEKEKSPEVENEKRLAAAGFGRVDPVTRKPLSTDEITAEDLDAIGTDAAANPRRKASRKHRTAASPQGDLDIPDAEGLPEADVTRNEKEKSRAQYTKGFSVKEFAKSRVNNDGFVDLTHI